MKILWLCNVMLPVVAQYIGKEPSVYGGWLTGLSNDLLKCNDVQLGVCFPYGNYDIHGQIENLKYYGFKKKKQSYEKYITGLELHFNKIINEFNPDIIHIFGTEDIHSFAMVRTCKALGLIDKVVVSIQGLVSVYAKHYYSGLPYKVINGYTYRDFMRRDNIKQGKKYFLRIGEFEIQTIKEVKHIIGRTDWDKSCVGQINPNACYYFCNETLRDVFYLYQWNIINCERHSIFISQAGYPIKGFHQVIEALPEIIKRYPDTHVYVAGNDITKHNTLQDKLKITSYGKHINNLIKKYKLSDYITFTGNLSEKEMCNHYLKANVFVSASSIENSPNSVGEAMILGVPVVSSDVGGVKNLMTHEIDGYIYQHDAPYMLSYYICKIFENEDLAKEFSKNSREHALKTHDRKDNTNRLLDIYKEILNKSDI